MKSTSATRKKKPSLPPKISKDLFQIRNEVEAHLRNVFTQAPVGICILKGVDFFVEFANDSFLEFLAKKSEEYVGKKLWDVYPEVKKQRFDKILKKVMKTGISFQAKEAPVQLLRKGKMETVYVDFVYSPIKDFQGVINKIMVVAIEVTDKVIARKKIEKSEKTFRQFADIIPQKVWTADAKGNVNYCNQRWLDYTGLAFNELKNWRWKKIIHPDDWKANKGKWKHALSTGTNFELEHRFRNKNGKYRWLLTRAVPYKDEKGEIKMWVGTNTKIHQQKIQKEELEKTVNIRTQELKQKNAELEIAVKELTTFNYISSHDLQEPLYKIRNFITLILEEETKKLSYAGKKYLKKTYEAAQRMQMLIEDILAYSRAKNVEQKFEKADVADILKDVKNDLEEVIKEKNARIDSTRLCTLKIIKSQFRQVFQNLISNALKFSKSNTPPHIIIKSEIVNGSKLNKNKYNLSVSARRRLNEANGKPLAKRNYCHLIITDNGIGFDPKYNERIFEVFQRLHTYNEYKGTGMGLAICKKIIENHKGFITATGKLNKGARFDIYVPV